MTGRFSAAAPMAVPSSGGRKVFGVSGRENWRKKSRLADHEVAQRDQLARRDCPGILRRPRRARPRPPPPIRSIESDDATSVSQS